MATVIVRLQHWKHTVPTTRERAEMIEDMRAAMELLESAALSYEQGHRDGYQAGYTQGHEGSREPELSDPFRTALLGSLTGLIAFCLVMAFVLFREANPW